MKRRNTMPPQRSKTVAMQRRTEERLRKFDGKRALLETWERQPDDVQIANHDYIIRLRATVRQVRNYLIHRSDALPNV